MTQGSPKAQCQWGQGRAPAAPGRLAQVRSLERLLLPGWGSPHSGPLSTAASSSCPRCTACHQRETRGTLQGRGPRPGAPALGAGPGPPGRHGSRQLPRPPRCLQQGPRVSPRALAHPPDTVGGSRRRRLPAGPDVEAAALSTGCGVRTPLALRAGASLSLRPSELAGPCSEARAHAGSREQLGTHGDGGEGNGRAASCLRARRGPEDA